MTAFKLYRQIKSKDESEWTELERHFMNQRRRLSVVSEILVEESKLHISSEEAVREIRNQLNKLK